MIEFYQQLVIVWFSLAMVKTLMGYVQLPMMLRIMSQELGRKMETGEIVQLVLLSPVVTFFAVPWYLMKENWKFFLLYDEGEVQNKFKQMKNH